MPVNILDKAKRILFDSVYNNYILSKKESIVKLLCRVCFIVLGNLTFCTGRADLTNPLFLSKFNLLISRCNPPTPVPPSPIVEQKTFILLSVEFCETKPFFFYKNMCMFRKFTRNIGLKYNGFYMIGTFVMKELNQ